MADQDDVTQGAIPPKVSPFAKPGGAPVTPAAQGAPRPITVRLKPLAEASAAPEAPVAAPVAVGIPAEAPVNPRATSRVPVPESVGDVPVSPVRPMTVRLRPVAAPAPTARSTQSIAPVDIPAPVALPALQPQSPPTPGSNPLPAGPKPQSVAQTQAAKSKTSRISLDSAIGVAPVGGEGKEGPKTIRLKRPTDLAAGAPTVAVPKAPSAAVRQTSRIPDSALPTAAEADTSAVTQKKTLKIKRPGAAEAAAGGEGFPEGVQMTPISQTDFDVKDESPVFTTVSAITAIAAAIVVFGLMWVLMAHAVGSTKGPNALAFMEGPDLPCAGRIMN